MKIIILFVFLFISTTFNANANQTRENVIKRGSLNCGVSQGNPGFSSPNEKNEWLGIDVDICKSIAAAILGDANKVKYFPTSAKDRFEILKSGDIDVLIRTTTYTLTRDVNLGIEYAGINYYDGQGFMTRKSHKIDSVKKLNNTTVCVETGTTTELNLRDYFNTNKIKYSPVVFENQDEVIKAYDIGRCDSYSTDKAQLAAQRLKLKNPDDHIILPETISKEPWGPVVRNNDENWENIVRWSLYVMIEAEEYGVTSKNIDSLKNSTNPTIKRLLGIEGSLGKHFGLSNEWSYNIIKQVGNYEESFERNIGSKSPFNIDRGLNKLWNKGGILYVPPVR